MKFFVFSKNALRFFYNSKATLGLRKKLSNPPERSSGIIFSLKFVNQSAYLDQYPLKNLIQIRIRIRNIAKRQELYVRFSQNFTCNVVKFGIISSTKTMLVLLFHSFLCWLLNSNECVCYLDSEL